MAERVIVGWLLKEIEGRLSDRQFGFRKGVGAKEALKELNQTIMRSRMKYVCGIFADIRGAFDNAWHPGILYQLRQWRCLESLIALISSYLERREVKLSISGVCQEIIATKGCPQGSILGPVLWNILFNGLLEVDTGDSVTIAYADDAVVVVQGGSRREAERKLEEMAEMLKD